MASCRSPFLFFGYRKPIFTNGVEEVMGVQSANSPPSFCSIATQPATMSACSSSSWSRRGGHGNAARTSASTTLPFLRNLTRMSSIIESAALTRWFVTHSGMLPPNSPCWIRVALHTLGAMGISLHAPRVAPLTALEARGSPSMTALAAAMSEGSVGSPNAMVIDESG